MTTQSSPCLRPDSLFNVNNNFGTLLQEPTLTVAVPHTLSTYVIMTLERRHLAVTSLKPSGAEA